MKIFLWLYQAEFCIFIFHLGKKIACLESHGSDNKETQPISVILYLCHYLEQKENRILVFFLCFLHLFS